MLMERSDSQLLADSVLEPECFAMVFERHYDEILRYLRRRYPQAAEDLATEVFTVAFDARGRFVAQGDSARPWLYGIASNLLAKRWRGEERALRAHAREGGRAEIGADEFADALARVDAQRQSSRVAAVLARLKPGDRDVLLLYALGELSYEEIAQALALPVGTVRSRLSRARRICGAELGLPERQEALDG